MKSNIISKIFTILCFFYFFVSCNKNGNTTAEQNEIARKDTLFYNFVLRVDTLSNEKRNHLLNNLDSLVPSSNKIEKDEYAKYLKYTINYGQVKSRAFIGAIDTVNRTNLVKGLLKLRVIKAESPSYSPVEPETIEKLLHLISDLEKKKSPIVYEAYELMARIYFNNKEIKKSKKYIDLWFDNHPRKRSRITQNHYNQILFLYALQKMDIKEMERTEKEIEKNVFVNLDSLKIAQAYEKKSILYGVKGKYDSSIIVAKKGLMYKPNYVVLYRNISESYLLQKDFVNALKYGKEGVHRSKDSARLPDLYGKISTAYFGLGKYKEALKYKDLENKMTLWLVQKIKAERVIEIEQKYQAQRDITVNSLKAGDKLKAKIITQQKWILAGLIFLVVLSALLFLNWRKKNRLRTVKNRIVLENEKLKLEQTVLQLKLNPHFIYNTVSNLQGLISRNKSEESISYLNKFARLMRSVLEFDQEEYISIKDEVEQISDYIQLQQMRYQGAFEYQIVISDTIDQENQLLPPMLLQPFVENAIIHGFNGIEYKGNLFISLENSDDQKLKVRIEDNGKGTSLPKIRSAEKQSLSTKIIEQRLKIIYGEGNTSLTKEINDNGCKIVLILPKTSDN